MKNLKGLEQRMSQEMDMELLDVKPKSSAAAQATSPGSRSDTEKSSSGADRNFWSFLPPIDHSQFMESTKTAWSQTRDLNVLCDENRLSEVLEAWVNALHAAQISVIQSIITFLLNYHNPSGQSYREDDTLRSTCSQITTSQDSSPSENCEISDRMEQEDPSVSESKSFDEDKHNESTHSANIEISDSSTLRTESVLSKLVNLDDFVFVYDPLRLSAEDHRTISELTMMCFQTQTWGKIDEVIDVCSTILKVKERILEAQKSSDKKEHETRTSQEFSDSLFPSSHLLKQSESAHSLQKSPQFVGSLVDSSLPLRKTLTNGDIAVPEGMHSATSQNNVCHSEDSDSRSSAFLQNYFHFFDVQKLREFLNVLNLPCIKTWNIMLSGVSLLNGPDEFTKKLASEQYESAANCLERSYVGPILISHLLKILKVNPSRAIELCLQRSYHITPLDVLYLSKSSGSHPKLFLEYVSRILDCLPEVQRAKVLEKLLHLKEVCTEWVESVLHMNGADNKLLKCNCGWPRPGSHLHPWKHSELLLHILSTSKELDDHLLLEKCFSLGFWQGYLLLSKKLKQNEIHKKVVVHLADIKLIDPESKIGYYPSNAEEWQLLFSLFAQSAIKADALKCLSCDAEHPISPSDAWAHSLTWENLSTAALACLDPIKVLEILRGLSIPHGALSPKFYKSLMTSFVITKKQSALKQTTLATVGSYLWSRKLKCLSPELRQVFQTEKEKPNMSPSEEAKVLCDFQRGGTCYLEEGESHWGMKVCLRGACKSCKMPLTSHLSSSQGGVTVYTCGHCYHTACSNEGFCIACLKLGDEDG